MKGHPHLTYLLNWFAHLPWQTQVKIVGGLGWLIILPLIRLLR